MIKNLSSHEVNGTGYPVIQWGKNSQALGPAFSILEEKDSDFNAHILILLFPDGDRHPDPKCGLTKNKRIEGGADATVSIAPWQIRYFSH